MKYSPILRICPYQTVNGYCVHKYCGDLCRFKNEEINCDMYNEWNNRIKLKSEPINPLKTNISNGGCDAK